MLEMNFFETFQKVSKPPKMKRQVKKIMRLPIRGLPRFVFAPTSPVNGEKSNFIK